MSAYSAEALQKVLNAPPASRHSDAAFYQPRAQTYYQYDKGTWKSIPTTGVTPARSRLSALRLITWNVDFLIPFAKPRMETALSYLGRLLQGSDEPVVVFLQEMVPSDLLQIQEASWLQERFFITDLDEEKWTANAPHAYGTTTLIDRRLSVDQVFRVPFISKFDRDGLFVDLHTAGGKIVRLCNVHLESLPASPPVRDQQFSDARPYLCDANVAAAVMAGDCNAIEPFDRTLHTENGLKDAYLELGGGEDGDAGYTWGFQDTKYIRGKFPPCRMDKVLFRGNVRARSLERIGIGLSVEDEDVKEQMMESLDCDWVTDHYGLDAVLDLSDD